MATTGDVGRALRQAMGSIQRWAGDRPARTGPTPTEVWLLEVLAADGPMRMSELAEWHKVDRSTVTAQVKRLVAQGWAERGADPGDRRAVTVAITGEGRAAIDATFARETATLDRALAAWNDDEVAELSQLLSRFAAALDDYRRS